MMEEVAGRILDIMLELITMTSYYGNFADFDELYYEVRGDTIVVKARDRYGERVVDSFDVSSDVVFSYSAEAVVREHLALKIYGRLLESLWVLRLALRFCNTSIYFEAWKLGRSEEGRARGRAEELRESFWYLEYLLRAVYDSFLRLEVVKGMVLMRLFIEELIRLFLVFWGLSRNGSFRERLGRLVGSAFMNGEEVDEVYRVWRFLSGVLHGSHEAVGGPSVIGGVGLVFDVELASREADFLGFDLPRCVDVLVGAVARMCDV